jgi:hypothetical protein
VARKQTSKALWMRGHCGERAAADKSPAVHRQHEISHEGRTKRDSAVRPRVAWEIARRKRVPERHRLLESLAETFSRDGINASGSIAD